MEEKIHHPDGGGTASISFPGACSTTTVSTNLPLLLLPHFAAAKTTLTDVLIVEALPRGESPTARGQKFGSLKLSGKYFWAVSCKITWAHSPEFEFEVRAN